MEKENRFNLVEEKWIPIVSSGNASLRDVFSDPGLGAVGGNPVQKVAITKLLLAIAQSACTPKNDAAWKKLGVAGLAEKSLAYLDKWQDKFYLYGKEPFLQMPSIVAAKVQRFGGVMPEIATGNTSVLQQSQLERDLSDAEVAMLLVQLMGFGLGGKKTDNSVVLTSKYAGKSNDKGKPSTGKPGSSLGFLGFLHSFLQGESIQETLWLNLFTQEQIVGSGMYPEGLGVAPWEKMPKGEDCKVSKGLKGSLLGRLVPVSRFCLLVDGGLHFSEGLAHPGYLDGVVDPSVSVDFSIKKPKIIWTDPQKRPWRMLTSLLSFLEQSSSKGFDCLQIRLLLERSVKSSQAVGIWSGGMRVSSNAGEQYLSGSDDFVESRVRLGRDVLEDEWYANLQSEMAELDKLSKIVYVSTLNFFKDQMVDSAGQAGLASNLFWQMVEKKFQDLLHACSSHDKVKSLRPVFANFAQRSYDHYCPNNTSRQIDAWAKNKPNLSSFLKNK